MANHVEVTRLHKKMDAVEGTERICAATLKDRMTGEEWVVRCRVGRRLASRWAKLTKHRA